MNLINVPVGEARKGETAPRRNRNVKDAAVTRPLDSKATTIYNYFLECVSKNGHRNAMGSRNLIEVHSEIKQVTKMVEGKETQVDKEWLFYELSPYNYFTYDKLKELTHIYGRGLVELGVKPNEEERLHIFATTSAKWMQNFLAATTQTIPVVTAYDTLGEAGLTHSLVQTGSVAVYTDNALIANLINPLNKATAVRYVIHSEAIDPNDKRQGGKLYTDAKKAMDQIKQARPDIQFISFQEVLELGKKSEHPVIEPKPESLCCIMYTSGTSGDPKGVVLTHENILAGIGGVTVVANKNVVSENDRIIAFLPTAHIFELAFELISFWWGGCVGYANVKTLTDLSVRNCQSDLKEFKPTVMVGVAAVWESVRKGVLAQVKKLSPLQQRVFWLAFRTKLSMKAYHIPGTSILDNLIFKKIKALTGGCLKILLNGGSAISSDAQIFISNLIAPMLVGYGLTETTANCTVVDPAAFEYGVAGALTGAVTVKLIDVPDAGYFAANNQGEVLIRGKSITSEYYQNEAETKQAFNEEGWFCTGDIGEWTPTGQLKVIDRKKNLVKTLNGEYIALEKIESIYRSDVNVLNICCYADESKVKPIAIILPHEVHLRSLANELNIPNADNVEIGDLCKNPKIYKAVQNSLIKTGKSQGLKGIELILGHVMLDEEWTPQNGFVTPAQKLQRKKILESCKDKVDGVYNSQG